MARARAGVPQARCSVTDHVPTPVRIARALRRDIATPQADRMRRRIAAVGRGVHFDLDVVPGIVLVRMHEHGSGDYEMPPGTVLVEVWGGEPSAVFTAIANTRPANLVVIPIWRRAKRWHRLVAWLRYISLELTGAWKREKR